MFKSRAKHGNKAVAKLFESRSKQESIAVVILSEGRSKQDDVNTVSILYCQTSADSFDHRGKLNGLCTVIEDNKGKAGPITLIFQKKRNFYNINRQRIKNINIFSRRNVLRKTCNYFYYNTDETTKLSELSQLAYEKIAEQTLHSLSEAFEEIPNKVKCDPEFDVTFEIGVLTVKISDSWGTYVINKQTPNKQIWLSSPVSGPFRYDFINNQWVYKRDGTSLHKLLSEEISRAVGYAVDFTTCDYSGS